MALGKPTLMAMGFGEASSRLILSLLELGYTYREVADVVNMVNGPEVQPPATEESIRRQYNRYVFHSHADDHLNMARVECLTRKYRNLRNSVSSERLYNYIRRLIARQLRAIDTEAWGAWCSPFEPSLMGEVNMEILNLASLGVDCHQIADRIGELFGESAFRYLSGSSRRRRRLVTPRSRRRVLSEDEAAHAVHILMVTGGNWGMVFREFEDCDPIALKDEVMELLERNEKAKDTTSKQ